VVCESLIARKLQLANNFETKVLLEESSDEDEKDAMGMDSNGQTESTRELRRILKGVEED